LLERIFNSGYYYKSTAEIKTKLVSDIYEYAYFKAKDIVLGKRGVAVTDKWYLKIKGASQIGVSPTDYLIAKSTYDTLVYDSEHDTKKESYAQALVASGYAKEKIKYLMIAIGGYTINSEFERHLDYLIRRR
jgi:hypothetical protein